MFAKFFTKKVNTQSIIESFKTPNWSSRNYKTFAHESYVKNVITFKAINMVAISISSIPVILYKIHDGCKIKQNQHPVLDLLNNPSYNVSKASFLESLVSYYLISGNVYILKLGKKTPVELHFLRPDRVQILLDDNNRIEGYRYTIEGDTQDFLINKITGKSDVLHIKSFHPTNDWYGLSPIEAASYSIDQHNQSGAWNQAMLQNGARPSGAIIVHGNKDKSDNTLSKEQYERLKEQIDSYYMGSVNTGRPLLLEGGLEWKEMSLSPKDMDFIEGKHSAARDIALAFGVPPQLLGIPGDNTYGNLIESRIALWEQTVLPLMNNILSHLNTWLLSCFEKNLMLSYDHDAIEVLRLKREKLWQYVENASFMTINEKREAFGLPPILDGDSFKLHDNE